MAGLDQRGRAGAGFHDPCVPQPFIETLALQATPIRVPTLKPSFRLNRKEGFIFFI
jgi:hypothetical protein